MRQNPIGVMQGRLLPKYQKRYQAHPVGYWQKEFETARRIGLDCIEFILDFNEAESNPLLSQKGIEEILQVIQTTKVRVLTVCADYFMEAPIHSEDESISESSLKTLGRLLENGKQLGLTDIVIPCVDQSSIKSSANRKRFIDGLSRILEKAEICEVNLSLETDLPPEPFAELIHVFDSKRVTINYDIGNSASWGYDPVEELKYYGSKISDIHIKDRILHGGSVELGTGNAQFDSFFRALLHIQFKGPFIMQAYRDDEGLQIFEKQLKFILPKLEGRLSK